MFAFCRVEDGNIVKVSNNKIQRVPVKWDRTSHTQFHDVRLKSADGTIFPAHKCILVARLEYFSIMFLRGWREVSYCLFFFCFFSTFTPYLPRNSCRKPQKVISYVFLNELYYNFGFVPFSSDPEI